VCSLLDCPVEEYIVESLPFVGAVVALIVVLTLWPGLVLFIPNALM
jgi:TRAP-type C4-dicarboxylate transport system permease large subunit